MRAEPVTLSLCGDVMLGRGIDQILAHPGDPTLRESYVRDARTYVELAVRVNGPIPQPADATWPWGEVLTVLDSAKPAARIVNLETAVTSHTDFAPAKAVHYRMHPANLAALQVLRPDVCVLANNHVLDHGRAGLDETLRVLAAAALRVAGAGRDLHQAWQPAVVPLPNGGGRLVTYALGMPSSGIPAQWAAGGDRPGVAYLPEPTVAAARWILERIERDRHDGDLVVLSVHWGPNWGYDVTPGEQRFARTLIDGGVDLVHGHSSHHPRPIEVHEDRLILYGCGDLIDDYEGIGGHERYRPDLRLLYLPTVTATGELGALRMVPLQARRMRLEHASAADAAWLRDELDRVTYGASVELVDGELRLHH